MDAFAAHPKKLHDGDWGALVHSDGVRRGDLICVTTRRGRAWLARASAIVWRSKGYTLCTTEVVCSLCNETQRVGKLDCPACVMPDDPTGLITGAHRRAQEAARIRGFKPVLCDLCKGTKWEYCLDFGIGDATGYYPCTHCLDGFPLGYTWRCAKCEWDLCRGCKQGPSARFSSKPMNIEGAS